MDDLWDVFIKQYPIDKKRHSTDPTYHAIIVQMYSMWYDGYQKGIHSTSVLEVLITLIDIIDYDEYPCKIDKAIDMVKKLSY